VSSGIQLAHIDLKGKLIQVMVAIGRKKVVETALVQLKIADETDAARMEKVRALLLAARGADIIVLPELWRLGYANLASFRKAAETIDGETVSFLRDMAAELNADIVGGSIVEKDADQYYNTAVFVDRKGNLCGKYRKTHLLSYRSQERKFLTAGAEFPVFGTRWGNLGIAICYDLRFPELFRRLAERGAELLIVPSEWPTIRMEAWQALCAARAVENQCHVVACNATGKGLLGCSMVIDPNGVRIAAMGKEEGVLRAMINLERMRTFRQEFPAWQER
jgi:predicted amidohydrolase